MNPVPFLSLFHQHQAIREQLNTVFQNTLDAGYFVAGREVGAFEQEYARFNGVTHCVSVGNGLDALICCLQAAGIGTGDEVIVPSHTCFATWLAVDKVGAVPVPVEVDSKKYTIDPDRIVSAIGRKTKAILPVHLYGYPCAMEEIMTIAEGHGLRVIEDNAQAQGAIYHGRITGSWGHVNATSFYPTKNLGALGDGGAVTTNDEKVYQFIRAFHNYGSMEKDIFDYKGINSRLDELQAAILRVKLQHLNLWNDERRMLAGVYHKGLEGIGDLQLPDQGNHQARPVFHLYVIQTQYRDQLKKYLHQNGVETAIHYPRAIHLQKAFKTLGYQQGAFPIAEQISQCALSLPLWPGLSHHQQERVIATIKEFFAHHL